ncbi:MAG: hypothetical protein IJX05_05185 [Clostridia bacterium]|nr:hypothetical protein [Clostridia bacterium]
MAYIELYRNIIFIEGSYSEANQIKETSFNLRFKLGTQLDWLGLLKDNLVIAAEFEKCNAVINFVYGKEIHIPKMGDISIWCKGILATIQQNKRTEILSNLNI